jgi:hypothetical protein
MTSLAYPASPTTAVGLLAAVIDEPAAAIRYVAPRAPAARGPLPDAARPDTLLATLGPEVA